MNKHTTSFLIMSFLLLCSMNVLAANLDVCTSGCDYVSIQQAIDSSLSGDVVRVAEGTYHEAISIIGKSDLTINGSYSGNLFSGRDYSVTPSIIDSQGIGNTILVSNSINIAIDGFVIKNGQAVDGAGLKIFSDGASTNTVAVLSNSVITENIATYGGGVAIVADNQGHCTLTMDNIEASNNRANYGAGVAVNAENGGIIDLAFSNNRICGNEADKYNNGTYGGGLYVRLYGDGAILNMTSEADSYCSNWAGGNGGGMAIVTSDSATINLSIDNTSIHDNHTGFEGAGIYFYAYTPESEINLTNSNITSNYSNSDGGGGVYLYSNSHLILNFDGNNISRNSSGNDGGGGLNIVNVNNMELNLTENNIYNNGGLASGGNIYLVNGSILSLNATGNKIYKGSINNNGTGGGLYFSNSGEVTGKFINNLFYENGYEHRPIYHQNGWEMNILGDSYNGGGISIRNYGIANLDFINNTITNNFTNSAIYLLSNNDSTNVNIKNSIVYGNSNKDFYNKDNLANINIYYTDIGEPYGLYNNISGNIFSDPLFLNKDENNYSLSPLSPCINVGFLSDDTPYDDIEGNLRPLGGGIDLGAFEVDILPPEIINFRLPYATLDLEVPLYLKVSDELSVFSYIVTENNIIPNIDDTEWVMTLPGSYRFSTYGGKTLYAYAKDAAGNISTGASASTTIIESPLGDSDADGLSDGEEIECGSNPLDPESVCSKGMPWLMLLLEDEN